MIRYRNIVAAAVLAVALLGLLPVTAFGQESAAGWYRFEKTGNGPNQDEQSKNGLSACVRQRHIADDVYAIRVVDVPENKGKTFDDLCKHIGLACVEVLDWQCNLKTCGEEPDPKYSGAGPDGSRIGRCGQRPDVK